MKKLVFGFSLVVVMALILAGCLPFQVGGPEMPTVIAATVRAELTKRSIETAIAQGTVITPEATQTGAVEEASSTPTEGPSATPGPTDTETLSPTPAPPTLTATLTSSSTNTLTITPTALPCDRGEIVQILLTPEGFTLNPGADFTRSWRLKNTGSCTWTPEFQLTFLTGNAMSGPASVKLTANVLPGKTVDVSLKLKAPTQSGTQTATWVLRNAKGVTVRNAAGSDLPLVITIKVRAYSSDNVPSSIYPLDFTASVCQADYVSTSGTIILPCAGTSQVGDAWVSVLMNPSMENHLDDERSLWFHLPAPDDSYVEGVYPAYTVKANDYFTSIIGCKTGSTNCYVTFTLRVKDSTTTSTVNSWDEKLDGKFVRVRVSLSSYVGKSVKFILRMSSNATTSDSDGIWLAPQIHNIPPTPTITPTRTVTPTLTPTGTPTPTPTPTGT